MPVAERDRVELYYERSGNGDLELLFVHGWCCDRTFFQPQVDHFAQSCSVTVVDLRGCGHSGRADDGYDIPSLADDLAAVCAHAGIARPVVVGHSLGGMIGVELAARHPSLTRAVVAVDPGPIAPLPESIRIFEALAAALDGPDGEAVHRAYVEGIPGPTCDDALRRRIVDTMCAIPLPVASAVIHGVTQWNGAGALGLCEETPVLILRAGLGSSNEIARLRALKPDVEYGVTVGAGHFHHLETPDQVNAMIERFLELLRPV